MSIRAQKHGYQVCYHLAKTSPAQRRKKMGDHSSEGTDYTSGLRFPMCVYCPRNWILSHSLPATQRPNTLLPVRHSFMWRVSRGHIVLRNQTTLIPHCLKYLFSAGTNILISLASTEWSPKNRMVRNSVNPNTTRTDIAYHGVAYTY